MTTYSMSIITNLAHRIYNFVKLPNFQRSVSIVSTPVPKPERQNTKAFQSQTTPVQPPMIFRNSLIHEGVCGERKGRALPDSARPTAGSPVIYKRQRRLGPKISGLCRILEFSVT